MKFWRDVSGAVAISDVVAEVLDARMVAWTRNKDLEEMIKKKNKKLLYVVNKTDLVSKKTLESIKRELGWNKTVFVSARENLGMNLLKTKLLIEKKRSDRDEFHVSFVGYPNVGKSSVINALGKRAKTKTSKKSGTTRGIQWVSVSGMKVLDSPGVIPIEDKDVVRLVLIGAKSTSKVRDVELIAYEIIKLFQKRNLGALRKHYGIQFDGDTEHILLRIGVKKNLLLKKGIIDERRAALLIIQDWQKGRLSL